MLTLGAAALGPMTAQAFTLIQPVIKLYVSPNAGYTTSLVQVRGTLVVQGICPAPPVTFKFTFDSKPLWSKAVTACNPNTYLWDTGWSAYIKPPVPPSVGTHTIALSVYSATSVLIGAPVKFAYAIYPAPSPVQRTSPTPSPSPTPDCSTGVAAAGCPSPSAAACPASAGLPPPGAGGFGDNLIAGLMVAAVLPIVGLALFGPGPLLAAMARRRRMLALLGLVALSTLTLSCTSTVGDNPNNTPTAAVSPSASPTPSC